MRSLTPSAKTVKYLNSTEGQKLSQRNQIISRDAITHVPTKLHKFLFLVLLHGQTDGHIQTDRDQNNTT